MNEGKSQGLRQILLLGVISLLVVAFVVLIFQGLNRDKPLAVATPTATVTVTATPSESSPTPSPSVSQSESPTSSASGVYYQDCAQVWADLGRPITSSDPGYRGVPLDSDGDGVGCEDDPSTPEDESKIDWVDLWEKAKGDVSTFSTWAKPQLEDLWANYAKPGLQDAWDVATSIGEQLLTP